MARARGAKAKLGRYYRNKQTACSWRVVHDPLEIGGFDKGALFSDYEVSKMLIYGTFTPGTILVGRDDREFEVVNGKENQWLRGKAFNIHVASGDKLVHTMPL